jgi:hypothetical protein
LGDDRGLIAPLLDSMEEAAKAHLFASSASHVFGENVASPLILMEGLRGCEPTSKSIGERLKHILIHG